jgi:hypothetical protein
MVHILSFLEIAERPSLDRLLGKSILNGLVHEGCMSEDGNTRSSNKPQNSGDWRGKNAQRNSNNEKGGVKLGWGSPDRSYSILSVQFLSFEGG